MGISLLKKSKQGLVTAVATVALSFSSGIWASDNAEPNWYLHFDVKGLQSSALAKDNQPDDQKFKRFIGLMLGKDSINHLEFATAYGFSEDNKVVKLTGPFKNQRSAILQQWLVLGFDDKAQAGGVDIYQNTVEDIVHRVRKLAKAQGLIDDETDLEFSDDDREKAQSIVYAAMKSDNAIILSDNLAEIKRQLAVEQSLPELSSGSMFEVIVDVKKALMHGGINLEEMNDKALQFESISAKQLSQLSVSYAEKAGYSTLQLGLKADTEEVANNIKAIVKGIIAMKRFSISDPQVADLLNNIRFEQSGGDLLVTVSGPIDAFRQLTDDKKEKSVSMLSNTND